MFSFLEKYSFTQENAKESLSTLRIKASYRFILEKIASFLAENGFEQIQKQEAYHELFAFKDECEYTFSSHASGSVAVVDIFIFSEKRGKTRKALIKTRKAIKELFIELVIK